MRSCPLVIVAAVTLGSGAFSLAQESDLDQGVRFVQEGDFEAALVTLDVVARQAASDPARKADAVKANVYLAVAYVGLGQTALAEAKFRQALTLDPGLRLTPEEFPAKAIRAFEAAREAVGQRATLEREAKAGKGKGALWVLGLGGAAAAGVATVVTTRGERSNSPPTPSIRVSPEGLAIVTVTRLRFEGSATDPEGEAVRFLWDFGDGTSTEQGTGVSHAFGREGIFNVRLTASDGLGASGSATVSVSVASLTGSWRLGQAYAPAGLTGMQLVQTADSIRASVSFPPLEPCPAEQGGGNGRLADARRVTLRMGRPCACDFTFDGEADASLRTLSGTMTCTTRLEESRFCGCKGNNAVPFAFVRE